MLNLNQIKQTLLHGWSLMRFLRLFIGILLFGQAFQFHDVVSGMFGVFFLYQAAFNVGCCGTAACNAPQQNSKSTTDEDLTVQYEEVK